MLRHQLLFYYYDTVSRSQTAARVRSTNLNQLQWWQGQAQQWLSKLFIPGGLFKQMPSTTCAFLWRAHLNVLLVFLPCYCVCVELGQINNNNKTIGEQG